MTGIRIAWGGELIPMKLITEPDDFHHPPIKNIKRALIEIFREMISSKVEFFLVF